MFKLKKWYSILRFRCRVSYCVRNLRCSILLVKTRVCGSAFWYRHFRRSTQLWLIMSANEALWRALRKLQLSKSYLRIIDICLSSFYCMTQSLESTMALFKMTRIAEFLCLQVIGYYVIGILVLSLEHQDIETIESVETCKFVKPLHSITVMQTNRLCQRRIKWLYQVTNSHLKKFITWTSKG